MPEPRDKFCYSPLKDPSRDVRLLVLRSGKSNALESHRDLNFFDLGGPRYYDALSYTWESTESPHMMKLDGKDFKIRTNLHRALHHLRDRVRPLVLWIDAICINQEGIEENNQQVQGMATIYTQASLVRVWLGQSSFL
jgi:hypothetical protein